MCHIPAGLEGRRRSTIKNAIVAALCCPLRAVPRPSGHTARIAEQTGHFAQFPFALQGARARDFSGFTIDIHTHVGFCIFPVNDINSIYMKILNNNEFKQNTYFFCAEIPLRSLFLKSFFKDESLNGGRNDTQCTG